MPHKKHLHSRVGRNCRHAIYVAVAFLLLTIVALTASAQDYERGCSHVKHDGTAGAFRQYRIDTSVSSDASDCASPGSETYKFASGTCVDWYGSSSTSGATPPSAPTQIRVYVTRDDVGVDHGANGQDDHGVLAATFASQAAFAGSTTSICLRQDPNNPASAPEAGAFRVYLRVCSYTGTACASGISTYDLNTDPGSGGGNPGTGNSLSEKNSGVMVGGFVVASFADSRVSVSGGNEDVYIGGDQRFLRLTAQRAIASAQNQIDLRIVDGASVRNSFIAQSAGGVDTYDASFTTPLTFSDAYGNATTPTKRALIVGNSDTLGEPWTFFSSVPAGITLTSETQIDGAWGFVDKGLRLQCTGNHVLLNRGERHECLSATAINGRSENVPVNAFVRVFRRAGTNSFADTTDVPSCDTQVTAGGAWTCHAVIKSTAVETTGLAYVVDMRQYSSAARTTVWNQGTIAHRFDVSASRTFSPVPSLACGSGVTVSPTIYNRGETVTVNFRLCNARSEEIFLTTNVSVITQGTGSTEEGPTSVSYSAGSYTFTYDVVSTDEAANDMTGIAKRLLAVDTGNTATANDAWNVSSLLQVAGIKTWRNACGADAAQTLIFVIVRDLVCQREGPVTNVRGEDYLLAKQFNRTYIESFTGTALPPDSETGVLPVESANHTVNPQGPESTNWVFTVVVNDSFGNFGETMRIVAFISPSSGDRFIIGLGNVSRVDTDFSVLIQITRFNETTGRLEPFAPDNTPIFRVDKHRNGTIVNVIPTQDLVPSGTPSAFWANWTFANGLESDIVWHPYETLIVTANITSLTVHEAFNVQFLPSGGGTRTTFLPSVTTIRTSIDAFVPFIVFAGLMTLFLTLGWLFPAGMALLGAAAFIPDEPIIPLQSAIMLILSSLVVQGAVNMIRIRRERTRQRSV